MMTISTGRLHVTVTHSYSSVPGASGRSTQAEHHGPIGPRMSPGRSIVACAGNGRARRAATMKMPTSRFTPHPHEKWGFRPYPGGVWWEQVRSGGPRAPATETAGYVQEGPST